MRFSRRLASTTVAVALVLPLSYEAAAHTPAQVPAAEEPFGAECRIRVTGSEVTAFCHNPYPRTDRVRLHVECARWWDLDADGSAVRAAPAQTVRLTGRCWKEVESAWISHRPDR